MLFIGFDLVGTMPHFVEINIYNGAGYCVAQPLSKNKLKPGQYTIVWNGLDARGNTVTPGRYIVEYRTERDSTCRVVKWPVR
jgi:flagellar hook assembly protein FlgD